MRFIMSFGLIILLSGCASLTNSYQSTVKSWQGANANSLVKRWGKPDIKVVGQSGNTYYIYRTKLYKENRSYFTPQVGVNVSPTGHPVIVANSPTTYNMRSSSTALYCSAAFEVTPGGTIVSAETKGTGCLSNPTFDQTMRNPAANQE